MHQSRSVTEGISRWDTSRWHYISLIVSDHGVKVIEEY